MTSRRPTVAIVSFRLGLSDGVSVVAGSWRRAFEQLGYRTKTVAGEGPVDCIVPELAIGAELEPTAEQLAAALDDADIVVVENLLTIPLHLPAARALARYLRGRPALLHHHDPPWQRERFAHVTELPPDDQAWRHVTINKLTETEFAERGLAATTIYNGFRADPPPGDRAGTRARLGVSESTRLVAHPVRAIERKNIPAAIDLTAQLGGTYWLLGDPEEGYDATLAELLANAPCPVLRHRVDAIADCYAASDLVAFPSTWEGFGNPPIEAALYRRPVVVGPYAVGAEIRAIGFRWFDLETIDQADAFLALPPDHPDRVALLDHNQRVAIEHFSEATMVEALARLIAQAGWPQPEATP
ncbi:MAG: glycosyltransferase family 4 protein [Acidimicrobiales bacterium]|nr:glycosyltransferase family 4 protein [Acidimicrobiales bacterium]